MFSTYRFLAGGLGLVDMFFTYHFMTQIIFLHGINLFLTERL